jgi:hypothetical protein
LDSSHSVIHPLAARPEDAFVEPDGLVLAGALGAQRSAHHVVLSAKDLRLDGKDVAVERTGRVARVGVPPRIASSDIGESPLLLLL